LDIFTYRCLFEGWEAGGEIMVLDIGAYILVPIFVFSIIIVGAYLVADMALGDVLRRRQEEERS